MKKLKNIATLLFAGITMIVMILDTKTALSGAKEGLSLCIQTAVPSLFPFFVFSSMINSTILGKDLKFLSPIQKICRIPKGTESILLLGCIAGYPVGAQLIAQAHSEKQISTATAQRMLGFCSNSGLSFIFGILSPMFHRPIIPWVLWGIHIISALLIGAILPPVRSEASHIPTQKAISFEKAMQNALKNISAISGWIILFRMIIAFCVKWFMWYFPENTQVLLAGFLELSNGCLLLRSIPSEGLRFLFASCILSAGGICVAMQTVSVTGTLGTGYYFPGKLLQTGFAVLLSILLQPVLFSQAERTNISFRVAALLIVCIVLLICFLNRKKLVAFVEKIRYNIIKSHQKGATTCYSVKR